jgi:hypothetical protein
MEHGTKDQGLDYKVNEEVRSQESGVRSQESVASSQ